MADLTKDSTPEEVRAVWKEDLRSGKFKQGYDRLRTVVEGAPDRFCCLGVLCERAVEAGLVAWDAERGYVEARKDYAWGASSASTVLPPSVRRWAGLGTEVGELSGSYWLTTRDGERYKAVSLAELNDTRAVDFEEIAQVIEDGKVATDER